MKKPNNNFWNDGVRSGLTQYINTNDIDVKNTIFNGKLYLPISILIKMGMVKTGGYDYYTIDNIQLMFIHILTKVLPKINIQQIKYSQSYIYKAICNQTKVMMRPLQRNTVHFNKHTSDDIIDDSTDDRNSSTLDTKILIIRKLDLMIREQRYINKQSSIFLIGLKEYILLHDFDVREFNNYIQEQMKISPMTYMIICSKLNIRSKLLNEKYIKDKFNEARPL